MYIDLAVLIVLVISAGVAFFRGFIREVLTIVGVLGGVMAAVSFGGNVLPIVNGWFGVEEGKDSAKLFDLIPYPYVALFTAYAGIFIGVFMLLQLLSHLLSSSVKALGLGPIDRLLGIFFGLARGVVVIAVLYLPFHYILPEDNKKEWFQSSQTFTYIQSVTNWMIGFIPGQEPQDDSSNAAREKLESLDLLRAQESQDTPESTPPETKPESPPSAQPPATYNP
jgi:membrane protein required for colicin V production